MLSKAYCTYIYLYY